MKPSVLRIALYVSLFLLACSVTAGAEPRGNSYCLRCHGTPAIASNGHERLHIDPIKFNATIHAMIGCPSCHSGVTLRHPEDGSKPPKASCRECHARVIVEYARSGHGVADRCTDCHNPHSVRPPTAVSGADITQRCGACHNLADTTRSHARWLQQAGLHITSIPCITCHTGSRNYVITMYIEKKGEAEPGGFRPVTYDELTGTSVGQGLRQQVDPDGNGSVSLAELRDFNLKAKSQGMRLRGMMMPEVVTHSYQILDNRWDCTFCHASGPDAMQKAFVSFPNRNGTYSRIPVQQGAVFDVLYGTPDFYMVGVSRNSYLDLAGLLIILGALVVPIVHGTMRFLTRGKRKEQNRP